MSIILVCVVLYGTKFVVSEVRKGATCCYVSAKINKSYVAINVASLAKRIRNVASSIVDFHRVRVYSSSMYREVSETFRATFPKPSRMKSPVVVPVTTFVYCRDTLCRYTRRFQSRLVSSLSSFSSAFSLPLSHS